MCCGIRWWRSHRHHHFSPEESGREHFFKVLKMPVVGLLGGPVVKTPCFHRRGTGSIPGWGTQIPYGAAAQQKKQKQKPKTQTTSLLLFSPHTSIILSCCSPVWNVFWSPLLSKSNKFLPNVKFKFLFSEVFQANTTVSPLLAFIIGGHTFYYRIVSSSRAKMLNRSLLSMQQNNLDPFIYSFTPQIEHLTSWVRSRFTNPLTWRSLGLDWG